MLREKLIKTTTTKNQRRAIDFILNSTEMEDATPAKEVERINTFMYYRLEKAGFSQKQTEISNVRLSLQRLIFFFRVCTKHM